VLVYESGRCKPLLKQAKPNGLELPPGVNVALAVEQL
jgi:hypothetical protein